MEKTAPMIGPIKNLKISMDYVISDGPKFRKKKLDLFLTKYYSLLPNGEGNPDESHPFSSGLWRGLVRDDGRGQADISLGQATNDPGQDKHRKCSCRRPDAVWDRDTEGAKEEQRPPAIIVTHA